MPLIVLPTRADGSIGRTKNTEPGSPAPNLDYEHTAPEHERIKDAVIGVCASVGLGDGSTAGSLEAMRVSLSDAPGTAFAVADGNGGWERFRFERSIGTPGSADDTGDGFEPGSLWIQTPAEMGAVSTLHFCARADSGAALWYALPAPGGAPINVGRAASAGTANAYAREDHAHDVSLATGHETASFTLSQVHEIRTVDTTSGVVVVTLPSPAPARVYALKKTNTGANKITLRPHNVSGSGPTIEGGAAGADYDLPDSGLAARGFWPLFSDGANWWVME